MRDRVLIVDDEPSMALAMAQVLRRRGFGVDTAGGGEEAAEGGVVAALSESANS